MQTYLNLVFYPWLLVFLIPLVISSGVGVFAWRRRRVHGARSYALVAFSQAAWTLGFLLELSSSTLAGKIFWDDFQFVAAGAWVAAFVVFTYDYVQPKILHPNRILGIILLPAIVMVGLVYTNSLHHLIRGTAWLTDDHPIAMLMYDYTPLVLLLSLYMYLVMLTCIVFLARRFYTGWPFYRSQAGLILIGNAIPVLGTIASITVLASSPYRDISPFTFAFGNLLVAWALIHYRMFDVVPIARDAVIENMQDGVIVLDAVDRVVDLNPAAMRGFKPVYKHPLGMPFDQLIQDWPSFAKALEKEPEVYSRIHQAVEGKTIHLELRVQKIHDQQNREIGKIVLIRDITTRVLTEEVLQQRTAQLEAANLELEAFSYSISHDLRSPLRAIRGFAQILQEDFEAQLSPEGREDLHHILLASARMNEMIEALLNYARLGRGGLHKVPVALGAVLEQVKNELSGRIAEANAELTIDPDLPTLPGDPTLFSQIFTNLINNALTYQPPGAQPQVNVTSETANGHAEVRVSDNGIGISPEDRERIFNVFQRLHSEEQFPGTGIGLSVVKKAVQLMGGEIWVESEKDEGSTFYIRLPLEQ